MNEIEKKTKKQKPIIAFIIYNITHRGLFDLFDLF